MKRLLTLAMTSMLAVGCTHSIHQQHISDIDPGLAADKSAKTVVVTTEQKVVLWFAFDTDYVDQAYRELQQKCPGRIGAVATQHSTSHGFMNWTNKIRMEAICTQ